MFTTEVVAQPLLPVDGFLPVGRVEPDPAMLAAAEADPATIAAWNARLARVESLLKGSAE
jgi:O-succinylbenzoate synthase